MLIAVCLFLADAFSQVLRAAPAHFADGSFQQVWEWTDGPVATGQVQRSWYWGPQPGMSLQEPYAGSKSRTRLVQYFDKARMEINDPAGDRNSEWFVTTGLLVAEMVSGKQQVGDKDFKPLRPAEIAVGGDGLETDPEAPTYTSFRPVSSLKGPGDNRASKKTGQPATSTVDRAGHVSDNPALGLFPGATLAAYSEPLGHNIPQAMWDFLNQKGIAQRDKATVEGQTLANWVYVMGYPITEPYWTRLKIGGVYQDALFQLYERRTLAYIPAMPKGWQVQMGNVGQHYYRWLYGGPLPAPLVPMGTPTPTLSKLPDSVDAAVVPSIAGVGAQLNVAITGFWAGEAIVSWFTSPNGTATDAGSDLIAGQDGSAHALSISTAGMVPGQWAITYHGKGGNHEAIGYFLLTNATTASTPIGQPQQTTTPVSPTPTHPPFPMGTPNPSVTAPIVPTEPAGGLVLSVKPGYGPPDAQFTFSARGLASGEQIQVKFTDPSGAVVYPAGSSNGQYTATPGGRLDVTLQPSQAFPAASLGVWLFEVRGLQSGLEGVIGFTLR